MTKQAYFQKSNPIANTVELNQKLIKDHFNGTEDLEINSITFQERKGKLCYLHTVADVAKCQDLFFKYDYEVPFQEEAIEIDGVMIEKIKYIEDLYKALVDGKCVLLIEKEAYAFDTPIEMNRPPEEPDTEKTVRGSHVGFIEDLTTNLHLIRGRIKNEQLKIKYITVGVRTNQKIAIIFMNDLANQETVKEIEKRISSIKIDMVFAPGFIEEFIEEHPFSPFPQNLYTERPDRVEAHLMEGRIALLCDNSADAIILPVSFFSFFQSPDDYNSRSYTSTVFRLLRLFSFIGTLLLPPLYIALVGFHFEMIPFELITLVKSSIEGVPFLPFYEALFMAVTVELIREAGIRLPSPIGETIGIVGGLIIGDAVINAGLVSNVMVIVIALTAIMSYTVSSYEMGNTVRILNFPIMIAAALFGFVGIVLSVLFIVIHLCKMESFKMPYLSPVAPIQIGNLGDTFIRLPIKYMRKRPVSVRAQKNKRLGKISKWSHD